MRQVVILLADVEVSEQHAASIFRVENRDVFLRNFGRTWRFHNPKEYLSMALGPVWTLAAFSVS
jgi:hypothetical protein